jgi:hypothetical protein
MILSTIIAIVAGVFLYWIFFTNGFKDALIFSLIVALITWIFLAFKLTKKSFSNDEERIRKQYATGFKWGKREHRAEVYTTRVLIAGILILGLHMWLNIQWIEYVAGVSFIVALFLRLIAAFCHKQEKKYMDEIRFNRKIV